MGWRSQGWGNRKRKEKVRGNTMGQMGGWNVRAGVGEQEAEEVVDGELGKQWGNREGAMRQRWGRGG